MTLIFPMKSAFYAAFLSIFLSSGLMAEMNPGQITVIGEGRVTLAPDQASLSLGAEYFDETAAGAMDATAKAAQAILETLRAAGLPKGDVQTSSLVLSPVWDDQMSRLNKAQNGPSGYRASLTVRAVVRDLSSLGAVLDQVTEAGGNRFSGLSFGLQEPGPHQDEARRRAVADAQRKAALYAEAAGVELGAVRILSEELSAGPAGGPMMMEMSMRSAKSMPIAEGEISLDAQIRMVFNIDQ